MEDKKHERAEPAAEKKKELVKFICQRLGALKEERNPYEHVWDEVSEFVLPSRGTYSFKNVSTDPERKSRKRYDSTAVNAARNLTARILAEMTGTSTRWFDFRVPDPVVDGMEDVRRFLQLVSDKAYGILNSSGFRLAHVECTSDWVAYGTACLFMHEQEGELIFKAIPVSELFVAEDKNGEVDTVYRKFKMSLRQAAQMWSPMSLPKTWLQQLETKPDHMVEIVHCVMPNADYERGNPMAARMKYTSVYISENDKHMIFQGFVQRMPYKVFRFWKRTGECYGGSPSIDALADIRMLNSMEEANIRSVQLEAFPPMVMAHDSVVMPLRIVPNGINFAEFTPNGRPLIDRLIPPGSDKRSIETMMEQKRQAIRSAFFVDPLINRENSIRTAAEVAKRANEEMVGIAPFLNRYETEYLTPVLDHILEYILNTDPLIRLAIPQALSGQIPTIEYTATLAKTQRAQELNNMLQFMQVIQTMAAADPTVMMHINMNATFMQLVDLFSIPLDTIVPAAVVEQQKQAQAMAQQQAMALQTAQVVGDQMQGMAKAGLVDRQDLGLPPVDEGMN